MRIFDFLLGLIWFVFSLIIIVESYRLDVGTLHSPQAGFLPFLASITLAILSLTLFILRILKKVEVQRKEETPSLNIKNLPKVLYVGLSIFIYAILLNYLGFIIDTILFIGFLLVIIEPQKWYTVVIVAFTTSLISYLLFNVLLRVQLPIGPLGF